MPAMVKSKIAQIGGRIGLMVLGIALAIGCVALTLYIFPDLIPKEWRDPLDQREANASLHVEFTEDLGDIFSAQPGSIRPPENPVLLAEFDVHWDEDGFRVPAMKADNYPIIALGDSYTEARNVEAPWTDILAKELNIPVRNLGYPGYGPIEYQSIMEDYGRGDRTWVLIGFFEGNDLQNIKTSVERPDGILQIGAAARQEIEDLQRAEDPREDGNYPYPIPVIMGSSYYEVAFFEPYFWQLNAEVDTYLESKNMEYFEDILTDIQDNSGSACVAIVYMPNKGHILWRNIEPSMQEQLFQNTATFKTLDEDGWLTDTASEGTVDDYINRLDNQRDAIQIVAQELGIQFIDLTPAFVEEVLAESLTYYRYDTHWNQAGHTIAGQTVAEYIANHPNCE